MVDDDDTLTAGMVRGGGRGNYAGAPWTARPDRCPPRAQVASGSGSPYSAAFVAFYRREYPGAARLAGLLTGSELGSEDLVQDAFMAMAGRFESLDVPAAYLRTSVVNLARRHHRDFARHQHRLRLLRGDEISVDDHGTVELADAVLSLPFRQRVALVGRYWGGWSEKEIAVALGCRPGSVKSMASRALATLRRQVEETGQ